MNHYTTIWLHVTPGKLSMLHPFGLSMLASILHSRIKRTWHSYSHFLHFGYIVISCSNICTKLGCQVLMYCPQVSIQIKYLNLSVLLHLKGVEIRGLHIMKWRLCVCVWDYEGFILYSKLWWLHCLFAEAFYTTILFIIAMNL